MATAVDAASLTITRAEYADKWPFTVDRGVLACVPLGNRGIGAVVFTAGGRTYALNGTAKQLKRYADVQRIWRDNPAMEGLKINIGPIIDRGLKLCGK